MKKIIIFVLFVLTSLISFKLPKESIKVFDNDSLFIIYAISFVMMILAILFTEFVINKSKKHYAFYMIMVLFLSMIVLRSTFSYITIEILIFDLILNIILFRNFNIQNSNENHLATNMFAYIVLSELFGFMFVSKSLYLCIMIYILLMYKLIVINEEKVLQNRLNLKNAVFMQTVCFYVGILFLTSIVV